MNLNIREYGDIDNIKVDALTIRDVFKRQGSNFIIDCLAEETGSTAIKFALNGDDRNSLITSLVNELKEALSERL